MKKSIFTIGLLSLVVFLTSFTSTETTNIIGGNANGGNMKLDIIGGNANGGNMKLD